MAELQALQSSEPDAALLAAAKARKNPAYAKEALTRARVVLVRIPDPTTHIHPSTSPADGNNAFIIPPLPPLAGFDGRPTDDGFNIQDMFPDNYPASAAEAPNHGEAAQVGAGQAANEDEEKEVAEQEAGDKKELKELESIDKWYNRLKNPTPAQTVRYVKAMRKLEIHQKRSENQKHLQEKEKEAEDEDNAQESDDDIFVSQNDEPEASTSTEPSSGNIAESAATPAKPTRKRKAQNKIHAEEKRKSMAVGFQPIRRKAKGKSQQRGGRATKPKAVPAKAKSDAQSSRKKGQKRKITDEEPSVLSSLRANIVQEAHASSQLAAPEIFTAGTRDEAVVQMVAAIPTADQEEAKSDGDRLKEALRRFNHRVVSDKQGGWKMKGMKTSMFNYQVLGCAFMRERENSPDEPRGGILADVMGIGKTLQALVNIVDGAPLDPDDPVKTTLLVVPSYLTKHWMDQIQAHCDEKALDRVIEFHAGSKFRSLNVKKELENYQVIITTYDEIRRSYPTFRPPKELFDPRKLEEQWKQIYEKDCGPLHRINFHRIILDEAHMIKNKDSSVSIAVRGLTGRHKWILSGTPIHNANGEFFSLLSFIGVPKLGEYEDFMSYYCTDDDGTARLSNLLRAFMMRRTHGSRFLSLPIIQLPGINEQSVDVEFSEAEWLIYEAIEQHFIDSINDLGNISNFKTQQCRQCLTMFLRLRMFCSHPLTVQQLLKELLRGGTLLQQLNKLGREGSSDSADSSVQIVKYIGMLQDQFKLLVRQSEAEAQALGLEQEQEKPEDNPLFYDNTDLIVRFSDLMKQLHQDEEWGERWARGECPKCGSLPDKPVITSCLHQWCEECFTQLYSDTERKKAENQGSQDSETVRLVCLKCEVPVMTATRYYFQTVKEPEKGVTPAERKTKRQARTREKGKPRKKAITEDEDDIENQDWMKVDTTRMPAAKITGIKNILQEWRTDNPKTKVVIFCQFTDTIQIIGDMCKKEKWKYRCLTGKIAIPMRHRYLDDFKEKDDITILLVSLHAGGLGLDMTVSHKCILVDLWWNEAIQHQAFCRLLRKGQTETVDCFKMVVKGTIDDHMLKLQMSKTEEISGSMGDNVLKNRDSVIALLKLFADVKENERGQLHVKSRKRTRKTKLSEVVESDRADRRVSEES